MKAQLDRLIAQMEGEGMFLQDAVAAVERQYIIIVLGRTNGNQVKAARALGIHRNTLARKIAEYGLQEVSG
jgi:DNA-binding NtrC family response regulator